MYGDCTNSIDLPLHSECRWQKCWITVKNLLSYTSAHCVHYRRFFRKEMKASYVMLAFVWGPGCACAAVTVQLHTSSHLLFTLNIQNWLSRSYGLVLRLLERDARPIYCQVREYDSSVINALRSSGFEHVSTRALLVRHIALLAMNPRAVPALEQRVAYGVKGLGTVNSRQTTR